MHTKRERKQKGKPPININTFQDLQCIQRVKNEEVANPPFLCVVLTIYYMLQDLKFAY